MPCLRPLVEIRNTLITLTIKFPEIAIVFLDQVFSEFNDNSYNLNHNETGNLSNALAQFLPEEARDSIEIKIIDKSEAE